MIFQDMPIYNHITEPYNNKTGVHTPKQFLFYFVKPNFEVKK